LSFKVTTVGLTGGSGLKVPEVTIEYDDAKPLVVTN
jgi:hypothetical protein